MGGAQNNIIVAPQLHGIAMRLIKGDDGIKSRTLGIETVKAVFGRAPPVGHIRITGALWLAAGGSKIIGFIGGVGLNHQWQIARHVFNVARQRQVYFWDPCVLWARWAVRGQHITSQSEWGHQQKRKKEGQTVQIENPGLFHSSS